MFEHPIEYALVVFPENKFSGEIIPELLDLSQRNIIRFVDIVYIEKDVDGAIGILELNDLDDALYKLFVPIGEHVSGIFTDEDLKWAANQLPENSSAVLFLWENLWKENIRRAIMASGGILAAGGVIPADVVEQCKQELAAELEK
jgi:hypothetical protein